MNPQGMPPQGFNNQQFGGFNAQPPMPPNMGMMGAPQMGMGHGQYYGNQGAMGNNGSQFGPMGGNNFGPMGGGNNFGPRGPGFGPPQGGFNQNNIGGNWNNQMGGNYQSY